VQKHTPLASTLLVWLASMCLAGVVKLSLYVYHSIKHSIGVMLAKRYDTSIAVFLSIFGHTSIALVYRDLIRVFSGLTRTTPPCLRSIFVLLFHFIAKSLVF
jgi:hypothetical protein